MEVDFYESASFQTFQIKSGEELMLFLISLQIFRKPLSS
jgi:hypothetical protein